jgi:hypothetical protein
MEKATPQARQQAMVGSTSFVHSTGSEVLREHKEARQIHRR